MGFRTRHFTTGKPNTAWRFPRRSEPEGARRGERQAEEAAGRADAGCHPTPRASCEKCMVRPVHARGRDAVGDGSSCLNLSGLSQVDCCCSQAMMRSAHAVPNKWFGHEARFFAQGLRRADPLFRHHSSRALQSSWKPQAKAGSLRS